MRFWIACLAVVLAATGLVMSGANEYLFFAGFVVLQAVVLATAWNILGGYLAAMEEQEAQQAAATAAKANSSNSPPRPTAVPPPPPPEPEAAVSTAETSVSRATGGDGAATPWRPPCTPVAGMPAEAEAAAAAEAAPVVAAAVGE